MIEVPQKIPANTRSVFRHRQVVAAFVVVMAAVALWAAYRKVRPGLFKNEVVFIIKNAALSLSMAADDNGGVYPSNLVQLASSPTSAYNAVPPEWHNRWKTFHYVSGLRNSDPTGFPILFYLSEDESVPGGVIFFRDGSGLWTTNEVRLRHLIQHPEDLRIQDAVFGPGRDEGRKRFADPKELAEVATRIKVLPPLNSGRLTGGK